MGRKKKKHFRDEVSTRQNCYSKATHSVNNSPENLDNSVSDSSIKLNVPEGITNSGQKLPVIFENYQSNSRRISGREHYINSLCQVCKEDATERVYCPKCQLVMYCSQDHRRQHWPVHADLCASVVKVCSKRRVSHIMQGAVNLPPDTFRTFRVNNMLECQSEVERPLEQWEREMFLFPNVCGLCHDFNIKNLLLCQKCLYSGFCKGHQTNNHYKWCSHLSSYKKIIKDQTKLGVICPSVPMCKISSVLPNLLNIEHAFEEIRGKINDFEFLELTDIMSYTLTALNVLLKKGDLQLFKNRSLTLHVVGAESEFEINKIEKWEYYIQHLIPDLQHLLIVFVGPELGSRMNPNFQVCRKCVSANKTISFEFYDILYHTFLGKSYFSKPDLICVFNPGLYRATGFNGQDSWGPTISSMFAHNCPVLITAYTHREILLDVGVVKATVNAHLLVEPCLNPFSSLKPNLNFVSDEDLPVIFKNHYYCVMR